MQCIVISHRSSRPLSSRLYRCTRSSQLQILRFAQKWYVRRWPDKDNWNEKSTNGFVVQLSTTRFPTNLLLLRSTAIPNDLSQVFGCSHFAYQISASPIPCNMRLSSGLRTGPVSIQPLLHFPCEWTGHAHLGSHGRYSQRLTHNSHTHTRVKVSEDKWRAIRHQDSIYLWFVWQRHTHTRRRWNHEWCQPVLTTCWSRCNSATFNMSQNTFNLLPFLFSFQKRIYFWAKTMIRRIDSIDGMPAEKKTAGKKFTFCVMCSQWRRQSLSERRWDGNVEHENISFLTKLKHHSEFSYAHATFERDGDERMACYIDSTRATILLLILSILICVMSRSTWCTCESLAATWTHIYLRLAALMMCVACPTNNHTQRSVICVVSWF